MRERAEGNPEPLRSRSETSAMTNCIQDPAAGEDRQE
jgi:hypothetical protein